MSRAASGAFQEPLVGVAAMPLQEGKLLRCLHPFCQDLHIGTSKNVFYYLLNNFTGYMLPLNDVTHTTVFSLPFA